MPETGDEAQQQVDDDGGMREGDQQVIATEYSSIDQVKVLAGRTGRIPN